MPGRLHLTRSHAILRLRRRLEHDSFPRVQMSMIVGLTGAAGLLFSFVLLQLGVTSMALRYPLALLLAYGVFLEFKGPGSNTYAHRRHAYKMER